MKNSTKRGLFHPDDIKTIGLSSISSTAPGPLSAPLPTLHRKASRPTISPLGSFGPVSGSHAKSGGSLASAPLGNAGSFGRSEAKKAQNQAEFGKYAEDDDDDDYEDVFGKPNATCACFFFLSFFFLFVSTGVGARVIRWSSLDANSYFFFLLSLVATEHPIQTLQLNTRLSDKSWVSIYLPPITVHL